MRWPETFWMALVWGTSVYLVAFRDASAWWLVLAFVLSP